LDKTSCDALNCAAVGGSVDITKLLLAAGAEVNASNDARQSAIEAATEALAFRVFDLLVAAAKTE
jgi:ankyrin repeat protein